MACYHLRYAALARRIASVCSLSLPLARRVLDALLKRIGMGALNILETWTDTDYRVRVKHVSR